MQEKDDSSFQENPSNRVKKIALLVIAVIVTLIVVVLGVVGVDRIMKENDRQYSCIPTGYPCRVP